jgi:hypothetical protein
VDGFKVNANSQWAVETQATNSVIQNNIVYSSIYGIQIGAQGDPSTPQVVLDSIVRNNFVQSGGAEVWVPNSSYNTIQGNLVSMLTGQAGCGIEIYYSNFDSVLGNEVDNNTPPVGIPAFRLRGLHYDLVQYNFGTGNGQPPIVEAKGSSDNTIINNFDATALPTPEPSSIVLVLMGGCALCAGARKKWRR